MIFHVSPCWHRLLVPHESYVRYIGNAVGLAACFECPELVRRVVHRRSYAVAGGGLSEELKGSDTMYLLYEVPVWGLCVVICQVVKWTWSTLAGVHQRIHDVWDAIKR